MLNSRNRRTGRADETRRNIARTGREDERWEGRREEGSIEAVKEERASARGELQTGDLLSGKAIKVKNISFAISCGASTKSTLPFWSAAAAAASPSSSSSQATALCWHLPHLMRLRLHLPPYWPASWPASWPSRPPRAPCTPPPSPPRASTSTCCWRLHCHLRHRRLPFLKCCYHWRCRKWCYYTHHRHCCACCYYCSGQVTRCACRGTTVLCCSRVVDIALCSSIWCNSGQGSCRAFHP